MVVCCFSFSSLSSLFISIPIFFSWMLMTWRCTNAFLVYIRYLTTEYRFLIELFRCIELAWILHNTANVEYVISFYQDLLEKFDWGQLNKNSVLISARLQPGSIFCLCCLELMTHCSCLPAGKENAHIVTFFYLETSVSWVMWDVNIAQILKILLSLLFCFRLACQDSEVQSLGIRTSNVLKVSGFFFLVP